jgi:hypothetical protein
MGRRAVLGLACSLLLTTACPADTPNDTQGTQDSTTHGGLPDECASGGGYDDYCCQYNVNYCDTTGGSFTTTTIPDDTTSSTGSTSVVGSSTTMDCGTGDCNTTGTSGSTSGTGG